MLHCQDVEANCLAKAVHSLARIRSAHFRTPVRGYQGAGRMSGFHEHKLLLAQKVILFPSLRDTAVR